MGNSVTSACVKKLIVDCLPLVLAIIGPLIYNSNLLSYCRRLGYDDASCDTNRKLWLFGKEVHSSLSFLKQNSWFILL